jgi:hypothetical protein
MTTSNEIPANAVPIRHSTCGKVARWYIGTKEQKMRRSADIVYLDGTRPKLFSRELPCPNCDKSTGYFTRCFDEKVDQSFDVNSVRYLNSGNLE